MVKQEAFLVLKTVFISLISQKTWFWASFKESFINCAFFLIFMADDKIRMPSSGAGLTTFYEDSQSKILISPQAVLGITVFIIILTMLLNVM